MDTPTGQAPLDYLNHIAPQAPRRQLFSFKLNFRNVVLLGIVAVILVIILAAVSGAISSSQQKPWEQLSARLNFTSGVVDDASAKLKNSSLRSMNSDLKLYLTNTERDIATPLAEHGIQIKNIPKSVTLAETNTGMTDRLETARLNAQYDSGYAREMGYQLATILSLIQELQSRGGNSETRAFLQSAYNNLAPTQKSIAAFSDSAE